MADNEKDEFTFLGEESFLNFILTMEDFPELYSKKDIALDSLDCSKAMFFTGIDNAYKEYEENRDWPKLAMTIWEFFDFHIGTGKKRVLDRPQNSLQYEWNEFRKNAQRYLSAAFEHSFRYLDKEPKEKACQALNQLLRMVESDRDIEEATSHGEGWCLPIYSLMVNEIKREIAHQKERAVDRHALFPVVLEENDGESNPATDRAALEQRITLNSAEAAIYLGVKKSYLYKLTSTNKIPVYRPGGKVMNFRRAELDDWLSQNRNITSDEQEVESSTYVVLSNGNQSRVSSKTVNDKKTFSSFEDFCLEKIRAMDADEREKFLNVQKGDRKYYNLGVQWKEEYNILNGTCISNHQSPVSRAKERFRKESKN